MGPKRSPCEDIIEALLDPRVVDSLCEALDAKISDIVEARLEEKFKDLLKSINVLKLENAKSAKAIIDLETVNKSLIAKIDEMDAYSKCDNLIFHSLPPSSFSEAVATGLARSTRDRRGGAAVDGSRIFESSAESEK